METAATAAATAEQPAMKFGKEQLKTFIERVERLEEEKKAITDDIRDVYAEAKGSGFDVKALRGEVGGGPASAASPGEHRRLNRRPATRAAVATGTTTIPP
jgi:hypothetical protein